MKKTTGPTIKLYKGGYISEEIAANNLNMTVDEFKELPEWRHVFVQY